MGPCPSGQRAENDASTQHMVLHVVDRQYLTARGRRLRFTEAGVQSAVAQGHPRG